MSNTVAFIRALSHPFRSQQHEGESMKKSVMAVVLAGSFGMLMLFCGTVFAQTAKVKGLITGRNAATMTVQTSSDPKVVVLLTDDTRVAQIQGMLKARRK